MTEVTLPNAWPLAGSAPHFSDARLLQNYPSGKKPYLLEFSRLLAFPAVRKEITVYAAGLGEAMRLGKQIADDSKGRWVFEKAQPRA